MRTFSPTGNLAQRNQQRGDVEELSYMARFINKAEEGYNMNMYALLPIKIVLISFTAGGGSVF